MIETANVDVGSETEVLQTKSGNTVLLEELKIQKKNVQQGFNNNNKISWQFYYNLNDSGPRFKFRFTGDVQGLELDMKKHKF